MSSSRSASEPASRGSTSHHTALPSGSWSIPHLADTASTRAMPRPVIVSLVASGRTGLTRLPSRASTRTPPGTGSSRSSTGGTPCRTALVTSSDAASVASSARSARSQSVSASTTNRRACDAASTSLSRGMARGSGAPDASCTCRPPWPRRARGRHILHAEEPHADRATGVPARSVVAAAGAPDRDEVQDEPDDEQDQPDRDEDRHAGHQAEDEQDEPEDDHGCSFAPPHRRI